MTSWAEFADTPGSRAGRHRRGAGTWTPVVPARRQAVGRVPEPFDAPSRGSLPLDWFVDEPVTVPQPATEAFPSAHGELPVPPPAKPPQRTRVKLTPPRRRTEALEDTDVRVYEAAPVTGLGSFDLGNVPASVTPPRSWRKAAWFATASSGGVVLALVFAGSAFVAKPGPDQAGDAWVPGLGGGVPTLSGERIAPPSSGEAPSDTSSTSREDLTGDRGPGVEPTAAADLRAPTTSTVRATTTDPSEPGGSSGGSTSAKPTPDPVLAKPAPSPAPYDADPNRFTDFAEEDPKTLASTSQSFLDTVTENPQAAHSMTGGDLQQEGTDGLARKYSDIAYFQVEYIRVHQYEGRTVCTVQAVYKDGRSVTEERTLEFSGKKITSDGA
ncbi:hypothetical protein GCM10027445_47530 [Amycolatopsis endophytica]|uniref:Uncharacterized protein n=1 Tax=Amycolatopsis endophytica TaxID=860233 RepID=A0A853AYD3_9PSEU|nr:hypothetical protein [Amycolatopsis endophytica]NYI87700.1 hypothetical protein [Amycolatopsis endophytica]